MQNARKNLKEFSGLVLFLLGLSVIRLVCDFIFEYSEVKAKFADTTEGTFDLAYIISFVILLLMNLPDFYVGIKGLKMAKNPNKSGAHIVWAKVLMILCLVALISPIASFIKDGFSTSALLALANLVADACIYFLYVKYATQVRAEA